MDRKVKVLFLAANPTNTEQLRLDEEFRSIDEVLIKTKFRDRFILNQHWAVRVTDLQDCLLRYEPNVVHFSGHGTKSSAIMLEDDSGKSSPVSIRALSQLFAVLKDNIRCVILNACYSEQQAKAIAEHIDCVIGMSQTIGDRAAISFVAGFYRAIGYGKDVKTAYSLGCSQIDLENLDEQDTPKLLVTQNKPILLVEFGNQLENQNSEKVAHNRTVTELSIEINDWYQVNTAKLTRDIFALFEYQDSLPDKLPIKLFAPNCVALQNHLRSQAQLQNNAKIVADQLGIVKWFTQYIRQTEEICSQLLINISKHYSWQEACIACKYFLNFQIVYAMHNLGRYQVENMGVLFKEVDSTLASSPAALAQFVYEKPELLDVIIAPNGHEHIEGFSDYIHVYLPPDSVANSSSGHLFIEMYEDATYIPYDVWLKYVVPQVAVERVRNAVYRNRFDTFSPWIRKGASYATEGQLWRGNNMSFAIAPSGRVIQR